MPRAPKNLQRGADTRDAILQSAIEVFARFGYHGTSLAKLAEASGATQSLILHHYGTKENVLLAVLDRYYNREGTLSQSANAARGIEEFYGGIEGMIDANIQRETLVRFFTVMAGESLTEGHPAQEFFTDRYRHIRSSFVDALEQADPALEPGGGHTRSHDEAALVLAAMDGLQLQWLMSPEVRMKESFALLTEILRGRHAAATTA